MRLLGSFVLTAAVLIASATGQSCPLSCRCEQITSYKSELQAQQVLGAPEFRVVCRDAPLIQLPIDELAKFESLTELVVERLRIETLSSAQLQSLPRLRRLVFDSVRIGTVAEHRISGLSALEELVFRNVSTDTYAGVAIRVFNNVHLERLTYTRSSLTLLDRRALGSNSALRTIDYSKNQLLVLDNVVRSFEQSPDLLDLNFEDNRLTAWPRDSIGPNVRSVNLANNELGSVAQSLSTLIHASGSSDLVAIDLSGNSLDWNDIDLYVLQRAKKLEVLRASRNRFGPAIAFTTCENLVEVELKACALNTFPAFPAAGCRRLSSLKLDENAIENLTPLRVTMFEKLVELSVAGNRIRTLDPSVFLRSAPRLQRLFLTRNLLTSMSSFPVLQSPSTLDLSHNALNTLPSSFADDSLSNSITNFNLSGNPLNLLFSNADQSPHFTRLGVRDLKLSAIGAFREHRQPLALCALPNSCDTIEQLDLSNNGLTELNLMNPEAIGSAVFSVRTQRRLVLDLRNNSLTRFPERLWQIISKDPSRVRVLISEKERWTCDAADRTTFNAWNGVDTQYSVFDPPLHLAIYCINMPDITMSKFFSHLASTPIPTTTRRRKTTTRTSTTSTTLTTTPTTIKTTITTTTTTPTTTKTTTTTTTPTTTTKTITTTTTPPTTSQTTTTTTTPTTTKTTTTTTTPTTTKKTTTTSTTPTTTTTTIPTTTTTKPVPTTKRTTPQATLRTTTKLFLPKIAEATLLTTKMHTIPEPTVAFTISTTTKKTLTPPVGTTDPPQIQTSAKRNSSPRNTNPKRLPTDITDRNTHATRLIVPTVTQRRSVTEKITKPAPVERDVTGVSPSRRVTTTRANEDYTYDDDGGVATRRGSRTDGELHLGQMILQVAGMQSTLVIIVIILAVVAVVSVVLNIVLIMALVCLKRKSRTQAPPLTNSSDTTIENPMTAQRQPQQLSSGPEQRGREREATDGKKSKKKSNQEKDLQWQENKLIPMGQQTVENGKRSNGSANSRTPNTGSVRNEQTERLINSTAK